MGKITLPATVVDKQGKILMWYLPGLLLPHRVVRSSISVLNLFVLADFWTGGVK